MPILGVIASSAKGAPGIPTIGTATDVGTARAYNNGAATVTFTAPTYDGRSTITSYTVTSSPSGFTGTGASSPITVAGLASSTPYTFTVTATNAAGFTSAASSASNSITATTIPQVPTITSATRSSNTAVSIAFTGATGGSALTAVTATSSPSVSITSSGTSSPMTATATYAQGTGYTFTITATNANGTSTASNTSGSVTPYPQPVLGAWSAATGYPVNQVQYRVGAGVSGGVWVGTGADSTFINTSLVGWWWNGSAWSQTNYGLSRYSPGMHNWDINTTLMGTGGSASQFTTNSSQVFTATSGSAWTERTGTPTTGNSSAGGRVTDGFIFLPGESQGTQCYSQTVLGGSWTAAQTYPIGSGVRGGTHEGLGQTVYTIENNSSASYKVSSITGSITASTSTPTGNANQSPNTFFRFIGSGGTMFYHANASNNWNTYLFNGTTFTASTSLPTAQGSAQWAGGAIGNVLSAVSGENFSATAHYRATLS